jgi:hypothetical protein
MKIGKVGKKINIISKKNMAIIGEKILDTETIAEVRDKIHRFECSKRSQQNKVISMK